MVTRRDLLKMGILGTSGLVLLPAGGGFGRLLSKGSGAQRSPVLEPFVDPLPNTAFLTEQTSLPDITPYARPFVGATTRFFEISTEERFVKFHRDLPPTPVWAYVDPHAAAVEPARLISFAFKHVTLGQPEGGGILIRHHNNLTTAPRDFGFPTLSPHFHGGHQPAAADGFPHNLVNRPADFPATVTIEPGHSYDYVHPLRDVGFNEPEGPTSDERSCILWFHDHILDFTGQNVYRGLANVVPVFDEIDTENEADPSPRALRLPSGAFDLTLVLQDKTFDHGGTLIFDPFNQDGFLGDTPAVNGVVQPFHETKRRKHIFRLLNGGNARIYELVLSNDLGQTFPMTLVATEGGLLSRPLPGVGSITLAMAERAAVVVDFADPIFSGQQVIYLENRMAQTNGRKPDGVIAQGVKLLKFILTDRVADPSRVGIPDPITGELVLRPFAKVTPSEIAAAEMHSFTFDRSHGVFTINGKPVDIEHPVATIRRNTPQIWHLENKSGGWWHPIHIHSEFMRVLRRNGKQPPLNERDGVARKDTILLRGGENVDVFLKFRDYSGPFVFHCHNIEHEDMAMMARFDIVD